MNEYGVSKKEPQMTTTTSTTNLTIKHPINLNDKDFIANRYAYYRWFREEAPVYKGKMSVIGAYFVSRYDDCVMVLKDPRFVRNRTTATGGGNRMPVPMPNYMSLIAQSMILEDEPEHRRLRNLVHKAFTPGHLRKLEARIETLTHELLDKAEATSATGQAIDLKKEYALPIPVTVISEMVGVRDQDMNKFQDSMKAVTGGGASPWNMARMVLWDMRKAVGFVRELIQHKRANPADDILTGLIQAEDEGQALTEDELISMVFLLIVAGYETTVHLITNSVSTLLEHPDQLERLRTQPELMDTAIEEIMRYNGPIHSTKPGYAAEEVILHGVTIPKGSTVMPLLGAANHDPAVFENPETFDIGRTPNRHLGFGQGIHYCLGAPLARIETKIALTNLLERSPNLRFAVELGSLQKMKLPTMDSYKSLPVVLG